MTSNRSLPTRWLAAGLGLALLAGGVGLYKVKGATHAPSVEVTRDVPHLEGTTIVFSPAFRDRAGVAFTKAERVPFKPMVRVVGTVSFNPSYVAAIGTRLRGTVRRTFKYEGDRVAPNEALAEVESAELGEAQATIAQAEATQKAAEMHARREQDLLDKGLTTAREAEVASTELASSRASLQAAQQRVKSLGGNGTFGLFVLRTPIGGHVVEHHISPGQSVDSNVVGYKVADLEHLWIELSVFERDIGSVHVGDDADVAPLAAPGQTIAGRVAHVGEVIDPATRSTQVRVTVDHPKYHLRVGQSVQATIRSAAAEREALLVPQSAVIFVDGSPTVFVAEGETRARAVTVRLGGNDGTRHEILEGVEAGQLVASAGVFALKSELFR
ncbi:MAG: efflux RND transporter periplasmic adaptor subunit [Labilithrix sp.]|nr:efflux RND transporter periplasmic adaptor subunit [Labilithrix sp.]MCW5836022.1 efflux RND transporter periplasmic adaptor subunit [Labilithrix sp.]